MNKLKAIEERVKEEILDVYIDYRDLDATRELVQDYDTQDEFVDHIFETYQDATDELIDGFRKTLKDEGYSEDDIEDFVGEEGVTLDVDRFLNEKVRVDILLAFYDDANLDMPSDSYGWLRWLAPTQGYSYKNFKNFLDGKKHCPEILEETFPKSVIQEIVNNFHGMTALTVLGTLTVREYFQLKEKSEDVKKIIVSKESTIGLFNPWVGGGSILEIELVKDLQINPKNIFSIGVEDECPSGYSVNQVYGLTKSSWGTDIKLISKKRL